MFFERSFLVMNHLDHVWLQRTEPDAKEIPQVEHVAVKCGPVRAFGSPARVSLTETAPDRPLDTDFCICIVPRSPSSAFLPFFGEG